MPTNYESQLAPSSLQTAGLSAIKAIGSRAEFPGTALANFVGVLERLTEFTLPAEQTVIDATDKRLSTVYTTAYADTLLRDQTAEELFPADVPSLVRDDWLGVQVMSPQKFRRACGASHQDETDPIYDELRLKAKVELSADIRAEASQVEAEPIDQTFLQDQYQQKITGLVGAIDLAVRFTDAAIVPMHKAILTRRVKQWQGMGKKELANANRFIGSLTEDLAALLAEPAQYLSSELVRELGDLYRVQGADAARDYIDEAAAKKLAGLDSELQASAAILVTNEQPAEHTSAQTTEASPRLINKHKATPRAIAAPVVESTHAEAESYTSLGSVSVQAAWLPDGAQRELKKLTTSDGNVVFAMDARSSRAAAIEDRTTAAMPVETQVFTSLFEKLLRLQANQESRSSHSVKFLKTNTYSFRSEYENLNIMYVGRTGPNGQRLYAANLEAKDILDADTLRRLRTDGITPDSKITFKLGACTKQTQIKLLQEFVVAQTKSLRGGGKAGSV